MTGLVPRLPRQLHAQPPGSIGELDDANGGQIDTGHFVGHVPVNHLASRDIREIPVLVRIRIPGDDLEALVARRRLAQDEICDLVEPDFLDVHAATFSSATMSANAFSRAAIAAAAPELSFSSRWSSAASTRGRSRSAMARWT